MKIYTLQDVRSFGPCYDPAQVLPEGWRGTLLDILRLESISSEDKIWFATCPGVLNLDQSLVFIKSCQPVKWQRYVNAASASAYAAEVVIAVAADAAATAAAATAAVYAVDVVDAYTTAWQGQVEFLISILET